MILYADSSALVKVILEEDGSAETIQLLDQTDTLFTATIAYVELRAALFAAIRGGRFPPDEQERGLAQLEQLWVGVTAIPVGWPLLLFAADLTGRWRLRGYDAVHAAALVKAGPAEAVTFACWDNDPRRAARELGYALAPA